MNLEGRRVLVTGGAGFLGSHLCEHLLGRGNEVTVVDDLSSGRREWIPADADTYIGDVTDPETVERVLDTDVDLVVHLAARKNVDDDDPRGQFAENTTMTHGLLEASVEADVSGFVFASSSTVYGEAPMPTPESHGPLEPISVYGAAKLGEEGLVSTFAHSHGLEARTVRFANVVGARLRGAVIPDFIEKLRDTPERLEILGDGRQEKSYLHVSDCVDAICHVIETPSTSNLETYNLGTQSTTSVDTIAAIVADEIGLDPTFDHTGGRQGWTGDVPRMRLDISRLTDIGWRPTRESDEAVRQAVSELIEEQ